MVEVLFNREHVETIRRSRAVFSDSTLQAHSSVNIYAAHLHVGLLWPGRRKMVVNFANN